MKVGTLQLAILRDLATADVGVTQGALSTSAEATFGTPITTLEFSEALASLLKKKYLASFTDPVTDLTRYQITLRGRLALSERE